MYSRFRKVVQENKTLVENFSYLSIIQAATLLLPFFTYPYLVRVLGADRYGLVIYAQVIATYFGILIDFGFKISATKDISVHRDDAKKLSEIVSSVLTVKLFLWLISLGTLFIMFTLMPSLNKEKLLFLFSFLICFNDFIFPQWYFQGVERMKYIAIINLIARLIFMSLIFIMVRQKSDYLMVPLLNGLGAFIGGMIGLYIVFFKDKIEFNLQPLSILWSYLKESSVLFGSNAIVSIKDRFNVIFIGFFLGMSEVAIYDLAIKIMGLFILPIDIINTTIYPRMARDKNMKFLLKTTKITFFVVLAVLIGIQPFLAPIIKFLGKGLENALLPIRLLLIAPLIMVWSLALGRNCLIVNGQTKIFTLGMFLTALFYLILIGIAYFMALNKTLITFISITILVYLFELFFRYFAAKHKKLI